MSGGALGTPNRPKCVICGDCLYREQHPDAATVTRSRKPKVPQAETLL